ncbi:CHASE2 domain-containing protein [Rhizorhabdus sp.]|uniref:CHASE2 domain-containing protein n=1 Tax=Rhizorhabdus sp. TaxID=1968843 RepID=UPI00199C5345|nr:CHASE2 domain-containing protein [Rhizorhabdus sp.]MBD3761142.1 CHASE2 domain-containing protein [Rhizorhabdus sp.]
MTTANQSSQRPSPAHRLDRGWLLLALIATLLVATLALGRFTERVDYILYDQALAATDRPSPDDIVIVAIDNRSIEAIGRWPWPRHIHAELLNRLADAQPRTVGYDVLFVDPTPDDAMLADAVRRSPTYLPLVIDVPGSNGAPYDIALPSGPLAAAAAGIAHVNLHFDGDRVIRQAYLEEGDGRRSWVQLGAIMAGVKPGGAPAIEGEDGLRQGRPVLIPYGGATGHIPSISFIDLLNGSVPPELIAGRHVLIGATADGLGDSYPTPKSGATSQMSGVEIQAHLLDALLRGDAIIPASPGWLLGFGLAVVWILLAGLLWLRPRGIAIMTVLVAVAIMMLSFGLFRLAHIWLPPTSALAGLIFVISVEAWRERVRLRDSLIREQIAAAATEGELQAGRTIQLGMLPPRADLSAFDPRLDVDALLEPAKSIGGDLYDVIRIDADRIAFLVGDVTGKGVPAALFMALSKALAKSVVLRGVSSLAEAASILNEELMRDNSESMNVTMLIGIMNLATGELMLMSAGHEHPLHIRADGSVRVHELDGGPPFCIVDFPYPDEPMKLAPGETLLLISDGVSEALNGSSALFGHERLLTALKDKQSATAMIEGVRDAVRMFEDGTDPTDDLTVMAVRYLGSA